MWKNMVCVPLLYSHATLRKSAGYLRQISPKNNY